MRKNLYHIIFLFLFSVNTGFSNDIDSLTLKCNRIKDNTLEKALLYHKIGIIQKNNFEFQKAIETHQKALKIRINLNDTASFSKSYEAIGVTYSEMGVPEKALLFLKKAYKIKKLAKLKKSAGISLYNIGNVYLNQAIYDSAFFNFSTSLLCFEETNFEQGKATCLNSLGVIYELWEQYDSALTYYQNALDIEIKLNNYNGMINAYNNIGNVYALSGINQQALRYYKQALLCSEKMGNPNEISNTLKNIGLIYTFRANYDKANSYLKQASKLLSTINKKESKVNILHALGYSYTFQKKCDSAIYFLTKSLKLAEEINYVDMISKNHNMLTQAYLCVGNNKKAFTHYKQQEKINEKLNTQLNNLKIQLIAEKEQKMIEILKLQNQKKELLIEKQNNIIAISIALFIIVIILIILTYRIKLLNTKTQTSDIKLKMLQLQMNPHFIHNSLASIEGYLFTNDAHQTAEYISEFSHLIRSILNNSREDFISIEKDISTLKQYLNIQHLRYKDKFKYEIVINKAINKESIFIPPMIAQPFIENAIEHGISKINKHGEIKIIYELQKQKIKITIIDNGIGIENSINNKKNELQKQKPLATKITQERLKLLSRKHKEKYILKIEQTNKNNQSNGTIVEIEIPFIEK